MYQLKIYREVLCHNNKEWCKFEAEFTCHFKILTRALENLKRYVFYVNVNSNVWAKKGQSSDILWHWKLMQNLEKNWLALSKITWRSLKICIGWNKWIAYLTKLFTDV